MVIEVLAEYRVKELLRRHGIKLSQVTARDIKVLANVWLAMHQIELVAQAKEMVSKSPEPQKMYEREGRLMLTVLGKLERVKVGSELRQVGSGSVASLSLRFTSDGRQLLVEKLVRH
jgi:hypothetical protein